MLLEIMGTLLILGILLFGWYDYRRSIMRISDIGVVMVRNRLNGARQSNTTNRT